MSTNRTAPCTPSSEDLLILVHGTYAGQESGDGNSWWQNGSHVSTDLKSRLPNDVRVP